MKFRRVKHKGLKKRSLKNWFFNHAEVLAVSFFVLSLLTLGFGYHLSTRKPQVKGASVSVQQPSNNTGTPFDPTTDTGGAQAQDDSNSNAPDSTNSNPTPTANTNTPQISTNTNSNPSQSNSSSSGTGSGNPTSTTPTGTVSISADTCLVTVTGANAGDTLDVLATPSGTGNGTFSITSSAPFTTTTPAASGDYISATLHDPAGDVYATPETCAPPPSSPSP